VVCERCRDYGVEDICFSRLAYHAKAPRRAIKSTTAFIAIHSSINHISHSLLHIVVWLVSKMTGVTVSLYQ
jgi:hypothetical protein